MLLKILPFDDVMNTVPFSLHWPLAVGAFAHIKIKISSAPFVAVFRDTARP
jgi:hypothetical protein